MYIVLSYQIKLIKMRAKLANLNDCAVAFLNRAVANLCWYYIYIIYYIYFRESILTHILFLRTA